MKGKSPVGYFLTMALNVWNLDFHKDRLTDVDKKSEDETEPSLFETQRLHE